MEARELRIGNIINDWLMVTSIDSGYIRTLNKYRNHLGILIDEARPIPLTEEILLKCGFEKDIDDLVLQIGNIILFVSYNDDEFVHCKNMALDNITSIKYLHQLQNLYFALTGEELEVNL